MRRRWRTTAGEGAPLFAVAAAGVADLVAITASRAVVRHVGVFGGVVLVAGAALLAGWWLRYLPVLGLRGRRLVRRLRRANRHLDPRRRPAWSTLSVDDLLMGMALFGPKPLRAVEPAAEEPHRHRVADGVSTDVRRDGSHPTAAPDV